MSRIDHARPLPSVLLNPFKIVDVPVSSTVGNLGDRGSFLQRLPVGQVCSPENASLYKPRRSAYSSNDYMMMEVSKREEAGIVPHPDVDTYMKAIFAKGQKTTLQIDHVLKVFLFIEAVAILFLVDLYLYKCFKIICNSLCGFSGPWINIYADTMVGDDMRRGISRGRKRRLTTGEMVVVPTKALFMYEISNCIDSSTAYQIVACLQQLVHITDATLLISLIQPASETFELFHDIILMAEGKVVYQGPYDQVVEIFKDCGFRCPQRKCVADFLQENSRNLLLAGSLMRIFNCRMINPKAKRMLFPSMNLLQIIIIATITMTIFADFDIDVFHATCYMDALFFGLIILLVDCILELSLTTARLPVFFKQKESCFYPAWAYVIPASLFKIPLLVTESVTWTCLIMSLGTTLRPKEIGLSVNEFLASRLQKPNANAVPGSSLQEKVAKIQGSRDSNEGKLVEEKSKNSPVKGDFNFLLSVGWSYFLNHLISNISRCEEKKKLQLLSDVTSALRPAVHTALIGVSGAGKSTLLDCMAGRKTTGHIEGQINLLNLLIVSWLLSYKLIASHTKSKPAIPCGSIPLNQIGRD
ncbi:hypothetical protein Patl1_24250 [Pistacia atlantica]|uniref:Uncharacterized protein n=1 Tax=Pistacia atlantica TaxID=434234 RepID=A0ACC0ZXU3_9ROSI|nr:hypothetical protein Patl1_24250 [Pistacia atlantica]